MWTIYPRRGFIQVINHRNIKNVGKSLDLLELFFQTREFILVIHYMNVRKEESLNYVWVSYSTSENLYR